MEILLGIIGSTLLLVCFSGWLVIENAWSLGGEYYISGNYGRKKTWLERLIDGFEKLSKF